MICQNLERSFEIVLGLASNLSNATVVLKNLSQHKIVALGRSSLQQTAVILELLRM